MIKFLLLTLLATTILISCECYSSKKTYTLKITYFNGQTDTLKYKGMGENRFVLNNGNLILCGFSRTLLSGVRQFKVLDVSDVSELAKNDTTWPSRLTLIKN